MLTSGCDGLFITFWLGLHKINKIYTVFVVVLLDLFFFVSNWDEYEHLYFNILKSVYTLDSQRCSPDYYATLNGKIKLDCSLKRHSLNL